MARRAIEFKLTAPGQEPLNLGFLPWPWAIQSIIDHGEYMEVKDRHGTSVVSLEDIHLSDLSYG